MAEDRCKRAVASVSGVRPSVPASAKILRRSGAARCGRASPQLFIVGALGFAGLTACAVGPDYHRPEPPMPASFIAASSSKIAASRAVASTKWWHTRHDRELNSLIERAIAGSPTLDIELNRLQQARAQEAVIVGAALPESEVSEGGALGTGSDLARSRASQPLVSAENGAIEAAKYDVDAAVAARNMVLISLVADVTRAYLDLRALQMQLAVLRKNVEVARNYVDFVQKRYNRGITNELDVTLAQRELAQLQAQVAPLVARINAARYVIAVLLGEFPETLGRELARPGILPALPARIRSGLPIDLLRRRPDIVEADRQLAGANALIGVATADLFPHVALIASAGWQQGVGATPGAIGPIWSVGPAAAVPLLDFGRLDALVEKADFRSRELVFNYKQTVLNAVREVDAGIDAYAAQQDRLRHLADALSAARRAVELATERFDRGLTDSLNVIDAQRQEYEIEQQYVLAQENAAAQLVTLYKSLGSGWEDYQAFPPIPPPQPAIAAAFRNLFAPGQP
jgi:NodT family efflux transporter outer membrane factor (OMF) lipoprotein